MKRAAFVTTLAAVALGASFALLDAEAADRVVTVREATIDIYKVELDQLRDGGCAVTAYASMTQTDGGLLTEGSRRVEVAGVNRTDCLNILDTRAPALFKSTNGF
jgi:hypothetical protein